MRTRWFLAALVLLLLSSSALATDWSRYRGPQLSGSSLGNSLLDRDPLGLEVAWKRPLGTGYSSISVVGDVGVTMLGDGTDDMVVAFDAGTGEELWRRRLAPTYKGHSGSDDGPISTPAIHDGVVYALGPRGQLVALRLDDGVDVWSRTLGESDSRTPHYGFATAPLVVDDLLIVQTGGEAGHSIAAFDRATGEPRWSVEDDPVSYQSPTLLELGGRRQVVAANDKMLFGLDPATGSVLWRHEHGTAALEAFTQPLALGGGRLLLSSLEEAAAFAVTAKDGGFAVEELWRTNGLQGSYAVPVHHEGYVYGFNGRFLTCLDAATGETAWKSRPPGGRGLILVDGQLVILAPDGELVVAAASPEGYRERARLAVLETGGITPPSFAGGRLYVRNLAEMAAVRVTDRMPERARQERELLGAFGDFVRRVEAAADKAALVDAYFAAHDTFPIVEGDDLVHFVYRGEVEDIALGGNFLSFDGEVALDRVAGTDVYFTSLRLDPEAVWEYRFNVDFGKPVADPKNPLTTPSFMGPMSVLRMPRWAVPGYLGKSDAPAGRLDSFQFRSEIAGNERRIRLYLPAGYGADPQVRYPVAVMLYGNAALDAGMERALDNLIAGGQAAPLLVAFVPPASFMECIGQAEAFRRMLAEELLPHLDRHYLTQTEGASRAILGTLDSGVGALYAAFKAPGTFGKVAVQSVLTGPPMSDELPALIGSAGKQPLQIVAEMRRHDLSFNASLDASTTIQGLVDELRGAGYEVTVHERAGSWGWSSWLAHLDEILGGFYPPPPAD